MSQNCKLVKPRNVVIISGRNILLCYDIGDRSRQLTISMYMANRILNDNNYTVKQFRDYIKYFIT